MSIIRKMRIEEIGTRRPISAPVVSFACEQKDINEPGGISHQFEYLMTLGVQVKFYANTAQYHGGAMDAAKRALLHELYGNALAKVDAAMHAIYSRDDEGALIYLSELRKELTE